MDLYASAALSGIGYALNKERQPNIDRPPANDIPSMKNMYSSEYWSKSREDERRRGEMNWQQSRSPFETGVIPKQPFANMFATPDMNEANSVHNMGSGIMTLAGEVVSQRDFAHNNMQPFFKGSLKQNIDPFANNTRLENATGRSDLYMHKKEVGSFFEPTTGYTDVCGMKDKTDFYLSRVEEPRARNNDKPFDPVYVGRGIGRGFTATPYGGYQQLETNEVARPKNVDELRVATKPRVVYELPVQGPAGKIAQRGSIGKVEKNRPDTAFEQTPDMLLRTTGAVIKEQERPIQMTMKATSRVDTHKEYKGIADSGAQFGLGSSDDHGKKSIKVYENERLTTQGDSIVTNVTSVVKSIISPLLDVFRPTPKEYNIDAPREFGNMHVQIPNKATTYDPVNHMMRTTIKETLIHDTTIMNLKGADKTPAKNEDPAKKTIRETTPIQETTRNIGAHTYKVTMYNIDAAKKTVRNTLPCNGGSMFGFISGDITGKEGGYKVTDIDVPITQKQMWHVHELGVSTGVTDFRPRSEEAERNAEIDGTREDMNISAGEFVAPGAGAYETPNPDGTNMTINKLNSDYLASREAGNVSRIIGSEHIPISELDVTRGVMKLDGESSRLDTTTLAGLKSNPFAISVAPI